MNANQILPGSEYAYTAYPGKNIVYYTDARRVRVLHIYKLDPPDDPHWYDPIRTRKQTLVECVLLDNETGEPVPGKPIMTVAARQIAYTWEEHLVEKERYDEEQRKEQERREAARLEREAYYAEQERERKLREQQRLEEQARIKAFVADKLGIKPFQVRLRFDSVSIELRLVKEVIGKNGKTSESIADSQSVS